MILILSPLFLSAQISGLVVDGKTRKPLEDVDVFIDQRSLVTKTDQASQFQLENVAAVFYQLVLYKQGHTLYKSTLKIEEDRHYKLTLTLDRAKKVRTSQLSEQKRAAIRSRIVGDIVNASAVQIMNKEDLAVSRNKEQSFISLKHPLLFSLRLTAAGEKLKRSLCVFRGRLKSHIRNPEIIEPFSYLNSNFLSG